MESDTNIFLEEDDYELNQPKPDPVFAMVKPEPESEVPEAKQEI